MTPEVKVEVAFGFGPNDAEPLAMDWVDISDHVYGVTIKRGRSSEFDQFPASTAQVVLKNDQREFDPLNADGDYYGLLTANVPIRVVATIDTTDYPVWRGYVDGWPAEYREGGFASTVRVNATDAFKILAERPVPDTLEDFFSAFGRPDGWYRCASTEGGVLRNSGTAGRDATILSPLNAANPLVAISPGAVKLSEQTPKLNEIQAAARIEIVDEAFDDNLTDGDTFTISAVVQFAKRGFRSIFSTVLKGGSTVITLSVASSGYPLFIVDVGVILACDAIDADVADGKPHHLVAVRDGTSAYLYVDGVQIAAATNASATGAYDGTGGYHLIGRSNTGDGISIAPELTIGEIMLWKDTALDATEVRQLHDYLLTGFADPSPAGLAIDVVLDLVGWSSTLRQLDNGDEIITPPVNPGGMSTLALLRKINESDGGRLFIGKEGEVTFHDRSRPIRETRETTVQYAFTDTDRDTTPTDVGLLDGSLKLTVDDRRTYDGAAVTRAGGDTQTSGSTAPLRSFKADGLLFASDAQSKRLADWIVHRYAIAWPRFDSWDVDPEILPADWPDLLGLEIGDRVGIELTPGNVGSALNIHQHIELIEHDIDPERWIITLNGSPIDPFGGLYLTWTGDAANGWGDTDSDPLGGLWH